MKFSFTVAYQYLHDKSLRTRFADLHANYLKNRFSGRTDYEFPPSMMKYLESLGMLDKFDANRNMGDWTPEMRDVIFREPKKVMLDISDVKVYLIRKTVQDICEKINFKEEKKFDYLDKMGGGNQMLILDETRFYKFYRQGSRIVVCYFNREGAEYRYTMFNFELDEKYEAKPNDPNVAEIERRFIQLLMFLEYAPHETILLDSGQKNGTRNEEKVINDSDFRLTVVDSAWNKVIIRTDGFVVGADSGGFLALRAYGEGRYQRRFVWIMPYEKHGYTRGVNKEKLNSNSEILNIES